LPCSALSSSRQSLHQLAPNTTSTFLLLLFAWLKACFRSALASACSSYGRLAAPAANTAPHRTSKANSFFIGNLLDGYQQIGCIDPVADHAFAPAKPALRRASSAVSSAISSYSAPACRSQPSTARCCLATVAQSPRAIAPVKACAGPSRNTLATVSVTRRCASRRAVSS